MMNKLKYVLNTCAILLCVPAFVYAQVSKMVTLNSATRIQDVLVERVHTVGNERYIFYQANLNEPGNFHDRIGVMRIDALSNQVVYNRMIRVPAVDPRLQYINMMVKAVTDGWHGNGLVAMNSKLYILFSAFNTNLQIAEPYLAIMDKNTGVINSVEKIPNLNVGRYQYFEYTDIGFNLYYPGFGTASEALVISGTCSGALTAGPYSKLLLLEKDLGSGTWRQKEIYDASNTQLIFNPEQIILERANTLTTLQYNIIGTIKDRLSDQRYAFHIRNSNLSPQKPGGRFFNIDGYDVRYVQKIHVDGLDMYYGQLFPSIPASNSAQSGKCFIYNHDANGQKTYLYDLDMGAYSTLLGGTKNNDYIGGFMISRSNQGQLRLHVAEIDPSTTSGLVDITGLHTYNLSMYGYVWQDLGLISGTYGSIWGEGGMHIPRTAGANNSNISVAMTRHIPGNLNNALYWIDIPTQVNDPCEEPFTYQVDIGHTSVFEFNNLEQREIFGLSAQPVNFSVLNTTTSINPICREPGPFGKMAVAEQIKAPLSTGKNESNVGAGLATKLHVWPNPIQDVLYLDNEIPIQSVRILQVDGKQIFSKENLSDRHIELHKQDIQSLHSGIYILQVTDLLGRSTTKKILLSE